MRQAGQAGQARERLLGALIDAARHPAARAHHRGRGRAAPAQPPGSAGSGWSDDEGVPGCQRHDPAKIETDFAADARRSVKAGFILDKVASQEDLRVSAEQLSAYVTEQAYRMGVAPDRLAQQLSENGQLGAVAADVLRGNALTG